MPSIQRLARFERGGDEGEQPLRLRLFGSAMADQAGKSRRVGIAAGAEGCLCERNDVSERGISRHPGRALDPQLRIEAPAERRLGTSADGRESRAHEVAQRRARKPTEIDRRMRRPRQAVGTAAYSLVFLGP